MIKLRRFMTPGERDTVYAHTYDHTQWPEHRERVQATIKIAQTLIDQHGLESVTDLSCGDGAIIDQLTIPQKVKKDIEFDPIEITSLLMKPTDLFVCTETIEHLQAPWTVLEQLALKTKWLLVSTPLDEDPAIGNHEHYWSFSATDVANMLFQSGFITRTCTRLDDPAWTYTYQIWTASVA
jgi:hypothetical protein